MSIAPEVSQFLRKIEASLQSINNRQNAQNTGFDEVKSNGVLIQESSTTTLPPNARFSFIRNGNFFTRDEVGSNVTHDRPLYRFPLDADDVWVAGGADRNAYAPGFEFEAGIASKLSDPPPEGKLLPEDIAVYELGYATLFDQSLTGVPNEDFSYTKDGVVLHIEPESADIRIYKDGSKTTSISKDNWDFDPYTDPNFESDPSDFWLIRPSGDLYGAGEIDIDIRLRDNNGNADTKTIGTLGISGNPLLRIFNHQLHLRVETTSLVTGSQQAFLGPIQFSNRVDDTPPSRSKTEVVRDATVADSPGDDDWTVVRVFRLEIDRREVSTVASRLRVQNAGQPVNAMIRSVHRDFLDFGTVNQDDDSNWRAGSDSSPSDTRETSIEVLKPSVASSNTVSISTFTDDDGITKIRGEKELTTAIEAGGGRTTSQEREGATPISELLYVVLVAQVGNASSDVDLMEASFEQQW